MAQVRRATSADFERMCELATEFNDAFYGVPLSKDKLRSWFDLHLATGVILMGDNSYISALIIADPMRDRTVLAETGWYAKDRSGAKLLLRLIQIAREVGAEEVRMTTLNTSPPEARDVLRRLGFEMDRECSHSLNL